MAQGTLKLTGTSPAADGTASLDLTFAAGTATRPASLEWAFAYKVADFQWFTVTAGTTLTAAGKSLSCAWQAQEYSCIASGMNATAIGDGVVASLRVAVAANVATTNIGVNQTLGASPDGSGTAVTGTGSSLTLPVSPAGLSCNAVSISTPGSVLCTVTLNLAAPTGGTAVALSSNNASLLVPASVAVGAGTASATFTGTAASMSTTQTAVITATLSNISKTASVQLQAATPAAMVSNLSCSPLSLTSGGSSSCTVTISRAALSADPAVTLASTNSAAVLVPASLTIPAGATSAGFTATAGTVTASTTAQVTASENSTAKSVSIAVAPAASAVSLAPVSLTCSRYNLHPGQSTSCTVTLSGAAPAAGAAVTVASSSSILRTPSTSTVAAGQTSGKFSVSAGFASQPQKVTLSVSLNGKTVTAPFTVGTYHSTN